jgi:hypothetical protein
MLEFYHNLEISENINPVQCTLLSDFEGDVHVFSYPEGLCDKNVFVVPGKNFFYVEHFGSGGWVITATHAAEEARMNLVITAFPAKEVELENGDNIG